VAIGDLETSILGPVASRAYPYPWRSARVLAAAPAVASQLKALGFALFARANEHALDWGVDGMTATDAALDAAGLAHAGTGLSEGQARSAAYYDDPQGQGRIALVSAATTFRPTSNALQAAGASPGRPGVSGLEVAPVRLVTPDQLRRLQQIACRFQHPGEPQACALDAPTASVTLLGSTFETASPGRADTTDNRLNRAQAQALLHFVRQARESADYLVVSLYADQVDSARSPAPRAPTFLEQLAHAAVDSGADLVMTTGRPMLGPIEIYRPAGRPPRPIFYGLGDFYGLAEVDGSVLTRTTISGGQLRVELYPLDLSSGGPRVADQTLAGQILRRLIQLSSSYGTEIRIEAAGATLRGVIQVSEDGAARS
jgi:poly-gamma-glutamate capsule biosynthesis protein CapA/YwtB (metallophosphatase superfamily)